MDPITIRYIKATVDAVIEHPTTSKGEIALLNTMNLDDGIDFSQHRMINRVLTTATAVGCSPLFEEKVAKGDAFWEQAASRQRKTFRKYNLKAGYGLSKEICPCYVCNAKCLRRLHDVSRDEMEEEDREQGFFGWHRGHLFPDMLGEKSKNIYNYRIFCLECNLSRGGACPADFSSFLLELTTETVATKENIRSLLDAVCTYYR